MDETTRVRDLLERATVPEPPIGPMVQNALRAGVRLRRRHRVRGIAAGAAAIAVICAAALDVATGNPAATPGNEGATVYVLGGGPTLDTVTPISAATNMAGKPIVVGSGFEIGNAGSQDMAITPTGKTIYVADGSDAVTPISTATNTAGKPIRLKTAASAILVTPDGKTAYVLDSTGAVTPISTATNTPGKPIELGIGPGGQEMAITPDGRTLYVLTLNPPGTGPSFVFAIATATNTPGRRIRLDTAASAILVTPDGKTAYIIGQPPTAGREIEVTPIATATNTPGKPISAGVSGAITSAAQVVMTADGQTIYILDNYPNAVVPFSTVTNTPGKVIELGAAAANLGIAVTPDGRTVYVPRQLSGVAELSGKGGISCTGTSGGVTPIVTATGTAGKPIRVGCQPWAIAVTPDGKTAYVASGSGAVTPIVTATGTAGKPIKVEGASAIMITP